MAFGGPTRNNHFRIYIAKAAITELINKTLPDHVSFTLRVFGHKEADACRSDLKIPAGPLNRANAASVVASVTAMNLARTPIAESLRHAASGTEVRLNIVGFAIDELMLQETFAEWARLGNGAYFNATDSEELTAGLRESVEQPYTVLDSAGNIIASGSVGGPPVTLDAGTYRVVLPGSPARSMDDVVINMEALTEITL